MKNLLFIILTLSILGCESEPQPERVCSVEATVLDLTGLDGCGFVFQLEDGSRIEPIFLMRCGVGMEGEEEVDYIETYTLEHGMKITFDYELLDWGSVCMVGQLARITCLQVIEEPSVANDLN